MIVARISGGLGNQMFQYALGRHLAIRNNTILKLDVTSFDSYEWHKYSLNYLNIQEDFANNIEIKQFKQNHSTYFSKIFQRIWMNLTDKTFFREAGLEFNADVFNLSGDIYLEGYWQSENYFKSIKDVLDAEFTARVEVPERDLSLLNEIVSPNSVGLHVRRGNYASVPEVTKTHGLIDIDYYRTAVDIIKSKISAPVLFIFSDDIYWAKNNLSFDIPHFYVESNSERPAVDDLRLMSSCQHNIIANSTFSWWAAWLNKNENKLVIAPKRWFNDLSISSRDIIPSNWIKL